MRGRAPVLCSAVVLGFAALTLLLRAHVPVPLVPAGPATPDAVLGPLAGLAAWLVAARLTVGVVVTTAALAAGPGRWHRVAVITAPRWLRRLVVAAVGAGLAGAALVGPVAAVEGGGARSGTTSWTADRPAADRVGDPAVVVVRGDSLWSIAASRLGPRASAGDVAVSWPRWYAANRARIGPDPDLVHPGQRLRPPPG